MTAGSIAVPSIVPLRVPSYGRPKNIIDTYTPIELKSETPNAEIFFTIDGSKPDPFAALGADRYTIKYTKPFKLREGKKTVKAVALSRDGTRQSHIVTKGFEVEKHDHGDNMENSQLNKTGYEFIDELERERKKEIVKKRGILKKIVNDTNNLSYRSEGGGSDNESSRYHNKQTTYLGNRFSNKNLNFTVDYQPGLNKTMMSRQSNEDLNCSRKYVLPDSSAQSLRLQRETDFLKCIYCFAMRPNDPHAKHCTECGQQLPQIPQTKLVTPQSGQMGTCFYCKSVVPFNTSICVICEMPITPQLQPQAAIKLQGKCICPNCTTANPANYSTCVACDFKLIPGSKIYPVESNVPQYPLNSGSSGGKNSTCSQCFRINRGDARFCDWCGAKPQKQASPINCLRCGSSNNPYSKFCITCGSLVQPPSNQNASCMTMGNNTSQNQSHQWLNNIDSKAMQILNKQYSTISTQTYGLFYTSAKGLENKEDKNGIKYDSRKTPLLTAVSAGKGYWRQQMDHVCAHLKAFAQNNSEFRVLVGEPRLGKINSAKVDIDSAWCTVTATFPIRNNATRDTFNSSAVIDRALNHNSSSHFNNSDYQMMAAAVRGRNSSLSEESFSDEDTYRSDSKKKKAPKKKPNKQNEDKLSGEDRQLVKELSKQGRGRPKEIRHLLNEGANPNAVTKDGLSILHTAIRNRHYECIPLLLESDADIKAKVPPKGNTVLHEAVMLGNEADSIIRLLIDFGANPKWKNSKNETPFELAIKENNTAAVNILGSQVGTEMINTYLKTKS